MRRPPIAIVLLVASTLLAPLASADEEDVDQGGGDGGYCVTVAPDHPPFVFVDPARCEIPPGGGPP